MKNKRGIALITTLAIVVIFLAIALVLTQFATANSRNVGNAYQKQQYYDVAEAGIGRGMADLDSVLPTPGPGFLNSTPAPPAPPDPSATQTPLPNVPGIPYSYSYWYNNSPQASATSDPLANVNPFGVPTAHQVNVPAHGAVVWSQTRVGFRDVAVEAVVSRESSNNGACALCAGNAIGTYGSTNGAPGPTTYCKDPITQQIVKICTDSNPAPAPTPTSVPIIAGGTYTVQGGCTPMCAYGDTTALPSPIIQGGSTSGFLSSQAVIDQLGNVAAWQALAGQYPGTIFFDSCPSGSCTNSLPDRPAANQITFVNGNLILTQGNYSYSGLVIVNGCVDVHGAAKYNGQGSSAETIALASDSQCASGYAINVQGNLSWNGGVAYAANGSINITGSGNQPGIFYGEAIAAGSIHIGGNGFFVWDSRLKASALNFGKFVITSFAQY